MIMSLIFNLNIEIEAEKWENEEQKEVYIENVKDVIEQGLFEMGVPDWFVSDVTVYEKRDDRVSEGTDIVVINDDGYFTNHYIKREE